MAFEVELGTGSATATALASVAFVDAFWADRGGATNTAWAAASTGNKQLAIVIASDYIRSQPRYRWLGQRLSYAQAMPWPRTGAVERDGVAVPSNVVPWRVAQAAALLAPRALAGEALLPDLGRGGMVTSESVGPISASYSDKAPPGVVIQAVDGLLAPLLRRPGLDYVGGTLVQTAIPAGYKGPDEFAFGSGE